MTSSSQDAGPRRGPAVPVGGRKRSTPGSGGGGEAAERRAQRRYAPLVIPAVLLLLAGFVVPISLLVVKSFTEFQTTEQDQGLLANYAWMFGTAVNVTVLGRTFLISALVTVWVIFLAYPFAYVMTRVSPKWRAILLGIVVLTFWTSAVIRNYAWLILLQRNGLINSVLEALGMAPIEVLGTTTAVVVGMAHFMIPFALLPLYASLSAIDTKLVLAAQGLGARPAVAFWRVYFPLSLPGLFAGVLLVFVLCLGFYITPAILGSPQNSMFAQLLVRQILDLLAWGRGGAMGVVLFVATMALLAVSALVLRASSRKGAGND